MNADVLHWVDQADENRRLRIEVGRLRRQIHALQHDLDSARIALAHEQAHRLRRRWWHRRRTGRR